MGPQNSLSHLRRSAYQAKSNVEKTHVSLNK